MISFNCSGCGQKLQVNDELAGKRGKCPHCLQPITVPSTAGRLVAGRAAVDADVRTRPPEARPVGGAAETPTSGVDAPQARTIPPGAVPAGVSREHFDFLSPPQRPDELGRLGTYRVLKVLGAGGMGVVFLAEDPSLDRQVALKAMLPTLTASESARLRFLREAKTAAALEHDHIVPIFQVGQDRGVPFIAMPFLKGVPLDKRLRREPILPLAETLRIGRETAKGLAAAHGAGLIHRDIKPANLWLEESEGRVKILDFGLARSATDNAQLTQSGAIMGTPAYMAPEQASGKPVDARCDLFALGCVLYRLCTGEMPFQGADAISTLLAVTTHQPPSAAEVNPAVPQPLSDLVMRLLAKNPANRPASAAAVVREIQSIELARSEAPDAQAAARRTFSDLTTSSPAADLPARRRSPAGPGRRWTWAALAAGLLATAAVAAVVYSVWPRTDKGVVSANEPVRKQLINGKDKSADSGKEGRVEDAQPVGGTEPASPPPPAAREPSYGDISDLILAKESDGVNVASTPAPAGATVLFDGKNLDLWSRGDGKGPAAWTLTPGGAMQVTGGDIRTREEFDGRFKLHVEFRVPYLPNRKGQARGNSGVYLQGRYEVQILDSYGLKSKSDDCGAIYSIAAPLVNACKAPTVWQSFDIDFAAPKYKGRKKVGAKVTVYHNGVKIHDNVTIPLNVVSTSRAMGGDPSKPGPIALQGHGNPVQFRNIWIIKQ